MWHQQKKIQHEIYYFFNNVADRLINEERVCSVQNYVKETLEKIETFIENDATDNSIFSIEAKPKFTEI